MCGIGLQVSKDAYLTRQTLLTMIDAESAAEDGGMVLSTVDVSYLGVQSIWKNDLGKCILLSNHYNTLTGFRSQW